MKTSQAIATLAPLCTLLAAGCAQVAAPEVPVYLQAPADQTAYLETPASGVQMYECAAAPGAPKKFAWIFKAPEATLSDRSGKTVGKHYAGPTWESTDGSRVVGEAVARDAGPDAAAIPWLLLKAKSNAGSGTFGETKSIQRVATRGGIFPTTACTRRNAGQIARVPYTATYYFYR